METKLKPFDLAAALEGKKIITRSGKILEDFHYFKSYKGDCPIYGTIDGSICSFYLGGKYCSRDVSDYDLFMAPETVTKWVNVYAGENLKIQFVGNMLYDSEDLARLDFGRNYLTTTTITFEI
jgi:hypothetical protein